MLAVALLAFAVDAPTVGDGWVRVINIKPSDGSCPGDLQYTVPPSGRAVCERGCTEYVADAYYCSSAPMKVYGLVTPTGESYRALTPV